MTCLKHPKGAHWPRTLLSVLLLITTLGSAGCDWRIGVLNPGDPLINNNMTEDVLSTEDYKSTFRVIDGVMTVNAPERVVWESPKGFWSPGYGDYAILNSNGELELHDFVSVTYQPKIWGTGSHGATNATLHIRDDSLIYITNQSGTPVWWSWKRPCSGGVNSPYGPRTHPVTGVPQTFHHGTDLDCDNGERVEAARSGVVTFACWKSGYGNTVDIGHYDGRTSRYAHLSAIHVSNGNFIGQGAHLGDVFPRLLKLNLIFNKALLSI